MQHIVKDKTWFLLSDQDYFYMLEFNPIFLEANSALTDEVENVLRT